MTGNSPQWQFRSVKLDLFIPKRRKEKYINNETIIISTRLTVFVFFSSALYISLDYHFPPTTETTVPSSKNLFGK